MSTNNFAPKNQHLAGFEDCVDDQDDAHKGCCISITDWMSTAAWSNMLTAEAIAYTCKHKEIDALFVDCQVSGKTTCTQKIDKARLLLKHVTSAVTVSGETALVKVSNCLTLFSIL